MKSFQSRFGPVFLTFLLTLSFNGISTEINLDTVYGKVSVTEPLLVELIQSPAFQRLKFIEQYGMLHYVVPLEKYSRYDHSIGVFVLLKRFGLSEKEQVAGLLHDVSHTVFSHVAEFVFDHDITEAYQDDIHDWFIAKSGVGAILKKYHYEPTSINPKAHGFQALDQKLPNLCADRIEYNLQGGIRHQLITTQEAVEILDHLHYENNQWYFDEVDSAKKFAGLSLYMTENLWGGAWNLMIYKWTSDALKRAVQINLINLDDIHFSTDDMIWHRLISSRDPEIKKVIDKIRNLDDHYCLTADGRPDFVLKGKFRGVDPLVKIESGFCRLTEADTEFCQEYTRVRKIMLAGWPIKLTHPMVHADGREDKTETIFSNCR